MSLPEKTNASKRKKRGNQVNAIGPTNNRRLRYQTPFSTVLRVPGLFRFLARFVWGGEVENGMLFHNMRRVNKQWKTIVDEMTPDLAVGARVRIVMKFPSFFQPHTIYLCCGEKEEISKDVAASLKHNTFLTTLGVSNSTSNCNSLYTLTQLK